MLELIDVCKTFNPRTIFEKVALSHVSLDVKDGDFSSIIGANGAGKSTLFNAICGSFLTDSGRIIILPCSLGNIPQSPCGRKV